MLNTVNDGSIFLTCLIVNHLYRADSPTNKLELHVESRRNCLQMYLLSDT